MPYRSKTNPWPRNLVVLGLLFLTLTGWSVYRAATRVSDVLDQDYYSHGLRFNDSLIERQAAQGLGWTLATEVRDGWLRCRLNGVDGRPVTGGGGDLLLRRDGEYRFPLEERGPGLYVVRLPPELSGEFSAQLILGRDGAHMRRNLLLNL